MGFAVCFVQVGNGQTGIFMEKVLIVENNKVFLQLFTRHLEGKGCEVAVAEDGLEALVALESFRPQVIFVDLVMPRINGEKLCRIVRAMPELSGIALVIVSAIAVEGEVDFLSFGADICIAKGPFSIMQVHIDTVLDHVEAGQVELLRGNVYGVDGIVQRPITRELLAAGRHFEILQESMADGFLELTPDAAIISANPAAVELFEVEEVRMLSVSLPDLFEGENRRRVLAVFQRLAETSVAIGEEEPLLVHGRFLLLKFVPFVDGKRRFVMVLIHDITRSKKAELELRQHRDRLEELVAERTAALEEKNAVLGQALAEVKTLSGLLPICASCKKIRDEGGRWSHIETYIRQHSDANFSHSLCPDCACRLYPDIFGDGNRPKS